MSEVDVGAMEGGGGKVPKGPQVTEKKQGLDVADVTGQLIFHSSASVRSNLRSERNLKVHPRLLLYTKILAIKERLAFHRVLRDL